MWTCIISVFLLAGAAWGSTTDFTIETETLMARVERGTLVSLLDTTGRRWADAVPGPVSGRGGAIHHGGHSYCAHEATVIRNATELVETCTVTPHLAEGALTTRYAADESTGDLVIVQHGVTHSGGMRGVEWNMEGIPLNYNILVPAHSGIRLTRDTPGERFSFDYPMLWEAQCVIIEGKDAGAYIWAEDEAGRFKRLTIERGERDWRLGFVTHAFAPFEEKTHCDSVRWRINVYEGDWRVPARRYRDWAARVFAPTPLQEQRPEWVRDARATIVMPINASLLDSLADKLDPAQTLLYVYDWRGQGYDRFYPDYDEVRPHFPAFMARAQALGFRVMLHVNYFGCHPEHPLYAELAPYHCRTPHGEHNHDWWDWPKADPPIKFAYINPASKMWRRIFVERMTRLCQTYNVDALHLDQTLVIYNDYNGPIDGMTMIEGNIALHRELREALPEVALSGEGLNEITYRHEAFAQRHVYGINHSEHSFDGRQVDMAHPIAAFLFGPYTRPYGYLGMTPPGTPRLHAAWLEAYRRWGVMPTLSPGAANIKAPTGFARQFFDEARFWMETRIHPDMEGPWPEEVAFPLRGEDGTPAVYTTDRRLVQENAEILRVLHGARDIALPGSVPGWRAYTDTHIIGLDPDGYYAHTAELRDLEALRVTALPEGQTLAGVVEADCLAVIRTLPVLASDIYLASRLHEAITGSRPVAGDALEQRGELQAPDGASFVRYGDTIHAHPPWKTPGSGDAWARFEIPLPDTAGHFIAKVALGAGAVGEDGSDGVLFGVVARTDNEEVRSELWQTTSVLEELSLDLRPFAGESIELELWVNPGPENNPSCDWARWYDARIVCDASEINTLSVAGHRDWAIALSSEATLAVAPALPELIIPARFPGVVYLLRQEPALVALPIDLSAVPYTATFHNESGSFLEAPRHAVARQETNTVGGVKRSGLLTHPPNLGRTIVHFALTLGEAPASFHSYIGLRDGAAVSTGVAFSVEVNGVVLCRETIGAGAWHEISADLASWAGQQVILALVADSYGDNAYDWACWGAPVVK